MLLTKFCALITWIWTRVWNTRVTCPHNNTSILFPFFTSFTCPGDTSDWPPDWKIFRVILCSAQSNVNRKSNVDAPYKRQEVGGWGENLILKVEFSCFVYLELESDRMCSKVCIKLCADVDCWRLAGGVLHHQEQLGDDLDDMTSLEDEVSLPLNSLRWQAARNVGLTPQLPWWRRLKYNQRWIQNLETGC